MLNFRKMILERPTLRRAVTRMLYGNQDSNVDLIGIHLHVNSVEESGYFRLDRFLKRSPSLTLHQEFPVIRHLAMILSPGDLFVDVGANVGLYSCALASMGNLFNDPDFAWAFEPHPKTFQRLQQSARGLPIHCINRAVASQPGSLEFVIGGASNTFTRRDKATAQHVMAQTLKVEAVRLDACPLPPQRPIVLKVDVEGQELDVLKSASTFFDQGRIKAVYLDGYDGTTVPDFLRQAGFRLFDGRNLEPLEQGRFNLLAIHQSFLSARPLPSV